MLWVSFAPLFFLKLRWPQILSSSPWLCSSPHKQYRRCHCVGLCLSCGWTHPRCSDLFHLCPRLLRSDRLNCRHPTKILTSEIIFFLAFSSCHHLWLKFKIKDLNQLEKCHNRRSRGCSLSSRSPQPKTDTAPAQAHGPPWTRGEAAWSSRACSKVTVLLCSSLHSQITTQLHCKGLATHLISALKLTHKICMFKVYVNNIYDKFHSPIDPRGGPASIMLSQTLLLKLIGVCVHCAEADKSHTNSRFTSHTHFLHTNTQSVLNFYFIFNFLMQTCQLKWRKRI